MRKLKRSPLPNQVQSCRQHLAASASLGRPSLAALHFAPHCRPAAKA